MESGLPECRYKMLGETFIMLVKFKQNQSFSLPGGWWKDLQQIEKHLFKKIYEILVRILGSYHFLIGILPISPWLCFVEEMFQQAQGHVEVCFALTSLGWKSYSGWFQKTEAIRTSNFPQFHLWKDYIKSVVATRQHPTPTTNSHDVGRSQARQLVNSIVPLFCTALCSRKAERVSLAAAW